MSTYGLIPTELFPFAILEKNFCMNLYSACMVKSTCFKVFVEAIRYFADLLHV